MEEKRFDYSRAVAELEDISKKVESPETGLDEVEAYVRRSDELIVACRAYLRSVREKVEEIDR